MAIVIFALKFGQPQTIKQMKYILTTAYQLRDRYTGDRIGGWSYEQIECDADDPIAWFLRFQDEMLIGMRYVLINVFKVGK